MKEIKGRKKKLEKFARGSISIFLCLLLMPFSTIALGIIELHRYQTAMELADELTELAALSAMAGYDEYLEKRFGLFAASQSKDINESFKEYFNANAAASGALITVGDGTRVTGKYSLNDNELLRQQIVDFGEATVGVDVLLEDVNIEEILKKLESLKSFKNVFDKLKKVKDAVKGVKELVEATETLVQKIDKLISYIEGLVDKGNELVNKASDLVEKVKKDTRLKNFDFEAKFEDSYEAIEEIVEDYKKDVANLAKEAKSLFDDIKKTDEKINDVESALSAITKKPDGKYEKAKSAIAALKTKEQAKEGDKDIQAISDAANDAGSELIAQIFDEFSDIFESLKSDLISSIRSNVSNALSEIKDNVIKELGLDSSRIPAIIDGDYFTTPVSEDVWKDMEAILKVLVEISKGEKTEEELKEELKKKFTINISYDTIKTIKGTINNAINKANEALKEDILKKISETFTSIINIINGLFDLDLFYDGDLNARVNIMSSGNASAQQKFLTAYDKMNTSISNLTNPSGNIWQKIKNFFTSIWTLLEAVGDMATAVFNIVGEKFTAIGQKAGLVFSGNFKEIYEDLIIAGYMTHDLPNRTNAKGQQVTYKFEEKDGGIVSTKTVTYKGLALTGYKYADLPLCEKTGTVIAGTGTSNIKNALSSGGGSDKMFCGAELEYIVAGTASEIANQTFTFMDIYFLRLICDLPAVFTDGNIAAIAGASTIAAWAVYLLFIIAEPLADAVLLANGGEVPIIRTEAYLSGGAGTTKFIQKMSNVVTQNAQIKTLINENVGKMAKDEKNALPTVTEKPSIWQNMLDVGYDTIVLIDLLLFVKADDMLMRFSKLIELESQAKDSNFDMNKTYCVLEFEPEITFNSMIDIFNLDDLLFNMKPKRTFAY